MFRVWAFILWNHIIILFDIMYDLIHLIYVYKKHICKNNKDVKVEIQIYATIELHREALYQGNANNVVDPQRWSFFP